jgi:hypothetical protein
VRVCESWTLSAIESVYEEEGCGQPPYHPRMITKVLLYGYCVGVYSSRRIQKRLVEDVAFRVLAADNQADFRTMLDLRKLHFENAGRTVPAFVTPGVRGASAETGKCGLEVKANASKHKAMSYGQMEETDKRLQEEVRKLLRRPEAADEEEDKRYGRDRRGDELLEELQRRETRIARIQENKKALEE